MERELSENVVYRAFTYIKHILGIAPEAPRRDEIKASPIPLSGRNDDGEADANPWRRFYE